MVMQDLFAFGCILLNTFNAYCNINEIPLVDYAYCSFCEQLANRLHMYALTLSDDVL